MAHQFEKRSLIQSEKVSWYDFFIYRLIACILLFSCILSVAATHASSIVELKIQGAIGPATAEYIEKGIQESQNADLILVLVDTPGGLEDSMRLIIEQFLSSKVPVVTYISPHGARAASAGTYIIYASTLAAMAPGTQLGAASPVSLGEGIGEHTSHKNSDSSSMNKKITNDAVATIRSLAQLRGRNLDFAQNAVLNGTTMTDSEALQAGVINYIANDEMELIRLLDRVQVTQNNQKITLNTANPQIKVINPGWKIQFLSIITHPTVAYLLILLGLYGIFFELLNPGFVLPGVAGAISMLIALYALQLLPINYAGLGLIILGILFMIGETFTPGGFVLGIGGTISFILGSIMLMNTSEATYQIAWSVIWMMALVNILIFILLFGMVMKARKKTVRHGLPLLIGAKGRALGDIQQEGQAIIRGEIWSVHSAKPITSDKPIKVIRASGLLLEIEEDYPSDDDGV